MDNLKKIAVSLSAVGYTGDCLELKDLWYAVRVGACSWQYLDLVGWLEKQIMPYSSSVEFVPVFRELRQSYLKITPPLCDPSEFRLKMIEYLLHVLTKSSVKRSLKGIENNRPGIGKAVSCNDFLDESMLSGGAGTQNIKLPVDGIHKLETSVDSADKGMELYNEKDHLVLEPSMWLSVVKDQSPTGEISEANWLRLKLILKTLIGEFKEADQLKASVNINFDAPKYNSQIRVVLCSNSYSAGLLHRAMAQLSEAKKLVVFDWDSFNKEFVLTAWTWMPETFNDPSIILDLIALHNNSLCTDAWSVVKAGPTAGGGRHYLLKLCRSALTELKATKGYLNFGSSRIYLRLNKELRKWFDLNSLDMGKYVR